MDPTTALFIILALVLIFYCVVSYFSAKTWRVLHVLLVICIFFSSVVWTGLAACILKTHDHWRTEINQIEIELAEEERQIELIEEGIHHGSSGVIEIKEDSILKVRATLGRELLDRGRVWKNLIPGEVTPSSIMADMSHWGESNCTHSFERPVDQPDVVPAADPAAAEAGEEGGEGEAAAPILAGPPPHGLEAKMIVYLFLEMPLSDIAADVQAALVVGVDVNLAGREEMCKVPAMYCGEFAVSAVAERSVTMTPTSPLTPAQLDALNGNTTWILFEMMPQDSHAIFADLTDEQIQLVMMTNNADEFLRHGQIVADKEVEDRWMRVKFVKDHIEVVDADVVSEDGAGGDYKRDFNSIGQTLSPWLRDTDGEGKVEFGIGDEALLGAHAATALMREQQACEEIERIYARPLRDFEFLFHNADLRRIEMSNEAMVLNRHLQLLEDENKGVIERGNRVAAARTDEINKLNADLERFRFELDAVQKHEQSLQAQREETSSDQSRLYRSNVYLADRLAAIQAALKKQIDEQTRQAAATRP